MAGKKGRSGTNKGKDKPFRTALDMEIRAAGDDHKALRRVAKALVKKAQEGDIQAIKEVADRLDGKPATNVEGPGDTHIQAMPKRIAAMSERDSLMAIPYLSTHCGVEARMC